MHTFTITLGRAWWSQLIGRNPLVRRSDRIQAWGSILAAVIVVVATVAAGAVGTSVHDARTRFYAEQAQHSHPVTATALESGTVELGPGPGEVTFSVRASWSIAGSYHDGIVEWPDRAKAGDQTDIWVDDDGEHIGPPPSPRRADSDAVGVAFSIWFALVATTLGGVYLLRERLRHVRYAEWRRELESSNI